ncbi:MAG: 23S rRNA (guanosine(2251)-2'-O)-methyltransferase RlmB [Ilumatobacteraceae bacterium]
MTKRPRRGARDQRRAPRGNGDQRRRGDGQQRGRVDGQRRGRGDGRPRDNDRSLGGEQIEGRQAVRELLIAQRRRVHEIVIADDIERNPVIAEITDLAGAQRVALRRLPRRDIDEMARSEAPQGVIARAEPLAEVLLDEVLVRTQGDGSEELSVGGVAGSVPGDKLFLVAVDGVTDPGNLGAILRSCEGAGVDAVILPRHRAVHITPSAAKAAAGAIEYLTMCVVPGLPTAIQQLRDANVWVVGLDDAADKPLFGLGDLAREHVCLVLGAEGPGLSRLVRERCDLVVSIPMSGALSSLNVSAAAALATYEVVRARTV